MTLDIVEGRQGDVTILRLVGRLVLEDGTDRLRERIDALARRGRVDIVLNFQDVECLDSAGIGTIVAKCLSLRRRGGDLKLVHLSARCRHVLSITHLLSIFKPFESEEAAVRSFKVEHQVTA